MIKKGLKVLVLTGKDKKKEGEVIEIDRPNNRAKVKDINIVKKHVKPSASNPQGGIEETEAGIHLSNVMLVVDGVASRIGRQKDENGKLVRYLKKNGEVVK